MEKQPTKAEVLKDIENWGRARGAGRAENPKQETEPEPGSIQADIKAWASEKK